TLPSTARQGVHIFGPRADDLSPHDKPDDQPHGNREGVGACPARRPVRGQRPVRTVVHLGHPDGSTHPPRRLVATSAGRAGPSPQSRTGLIAPAGPTTASRLRARLAPT